MMKFTEFEIPSQRDGREETKPWVNTFHAAGGYGTRR